MQYTPPKIDKNTLVVVINNPAVSQNSTMSGHLGPAELGIVVSEGKGTFNVQVFKTRIGKRSGKEFNIINVPMEAVFKVRSYVKDNNLVEMNSENTKLIDDALKCLVENKQS